MKQRYQRKNLSIVMVWAMILSVLGSNIAPVGAQENDLGDSQINTESAYNVELTINKDGQPFDEHGKILTLRQDGENKSTGEGSDSTVTFVVDEGTYHIFDGDVDTGKSVVVASEIAKQELDYYTVNFEVENEGASRGSVITAKYENDYISSGDVVLGGEALEIVSEGRGITQSGTLEAGYSYSWSGTDTGATNENGDTLTINDLDHEVAVLSTVTGGLRLYSAGRNSEDIENARYILPEKLSSGKITIEFDVTSKVTSPNTAISFVQSGAAVNADTPDMNAIIRFDGVIDAYNDNAWGASKGVSAPQHANTVQHVKVLLDMDAKTYSAWVTSEVGSETEIATNYKFRAKNPSDIGEIRVIDTRNSGDNKATGDLWIENISISTKPTLTVQLNGEPHPNIQDIEFTLVQGDVVKATGINNGNTVTFEEVLEDGTYDIYIDGVNKGVTFAITNGQGNVLIDLGTDESKARKELEDLVQIIEDQGPREDRYTPETWVPFEDAFTLAKELLLVEDTAADDLNTAKSNLSNTYEALELIPRANGIYKAAYADYFGETEIRRNIGNTTNGATFPNGSYSTPPAGQLNERAVVGNFHTGSDAQTYRAKPGAGVTFPFEIHKDGTFGFMLKFSRINYEIEDYISVYVNYDQVEKNSEGAPTTPGIYRIPLVGRDSELVFVESDIWELDLKEGDTISLVLDTASLDVVDYPDKGLVNIDYISVWEVEEDYTYDSFNRNFYLVKGSEIIIPEPVNYPLKWSSSNEDIAQVDPNTGKIVANEAGDVVITSKGNGNEFKYNLFIKDSAAEINLKSEHVSLWDMEKNTFDPPAKVRKSNANEVPDNIPIAESGLGGGNKVGNGFVDTMDYVPVGSSIEMDVPAGVVDKAGLYDITLNYAKGSSQAYGQLGLLVNGKLSGTLHTRTTASLTSTEQSNVVTVYLVPGDRIGIRTILNPKDAVGRFNSLTVTENVVIPPSSITLDDASVNYQDQTTLNYTTVPANATPAFEWAVGDSNILSVYGNLVVGQNVGETTVTATSIYNPNVNASATVTVEPNDSIFTIESDKMKVYLDKDFPRAIQYEMESGAKIDGNRTKLDTLRLTTDMTYGLNTPQALTGSKVADYKPVVTTSEPIKNADGSEHIIYTLQVAELNAELKMKVAVEGTVLKFDFVEITDQPDNRIYVIEIPDHNPITVSNFDSGSTFAGSKMESNIGRSGDMFAEIKEMLAGTDAYHYAFASNGSVAGGIKSNAYTLTGERRVVANTTKNDSLITTSMQSGSWLWRFPDATKTFVDYEGRYGDSEKLITNTYKDIPDDRERPHVWVVLAEDNNNDHVVDWQDAANEFRKVAKVAVGSDKIADAVVQRLIMSQGNETNYPYLASLDETKRIWLHTEGLGQIILQKYHNAGNWGDFSYYDDQLGGLDEFRKFTDITTEQYNSFVGVHTNFTEYFAKVDQFSYENVEMQADGITPRSKGYVAFGYYLHQAYVIDDQLDALTRYNPNAASREKSRYERLKRFKTDIPNLGFVYSDVYSHNGWRGNAHAWDYADNDLALFVEWPYVMEDASPWAHWSVEKSYSPASLKGYSSDIARFIFNDTKDRWDNYTTNNWKADIEETRVPNSAFLLMGADTTSYEGWVHNGINEYDSIIEKIYRNNIPSKYMQHFPITLMEKDNEGWANYIEFNNGEVKVYAEGYEASNNDTRNSKRIIEKDGKKIYEHNSSIGTDQGATKYLIPWNEGEMQVLDGVEETEIKLYHWNDDGGNSTWELPNSWKGLDKIYMYELSDLGKISEKEINVVNNEVTIEAKSRTPYIVFKEQQDMDVDVEFGEGQYVYNPGFSTGNLDGWETVQGDPQVVRNDNENMPLFTTGGDKAALNSNADNHGRSRNWELAIQNGQETEISQEITGLVPGDEYAVSVMVEVERGKTRNASLIVDTDQETTYSNYTDSSILLNYDRYDSKEKTSMLRMRVVFTAVSEKATIRLHTEQGYGEVRFDNVRAYKITTPVPNTVVNDGKIVLYQDFESAPDRLSEAGTSVNKPTFEGFYPFNLGNGGGFREARTIIQRRHDPYTQNNTVPEWNNNAPERVKNYIQPTKDQAGNTVTGSWWDTTTIPIDLVVDGNNSFSNITGSVGIMYQTAPQSVRFEKGKTYRIGFEYQTGLNGTFAFVLGNGMDGTIRQTVSQTNVEFNGLEHFDYLQGTMGPYFGDVLSNRADGDVAITAMPAGWTSTDEFRNIDIKTAVPNWRGYYEYEFESQSDQTWFGILRNSTNPSPGDNPNPFIIDNLLIVEVGEDATLSELSVSEGTLSPEFNANTLNYKVNVANDVSSITIGATANDEAATVTGAGEQSLEVGSNTFKVVVTGKEGTQQTYTIVVIRAGEDASDDTTLAELSVSEGALSPKFSVDTTNYSVKVGNKVSTITIDAKANDDNATVTGTGEKSLAVGNNTFDVVVTAEDGTQQTYTIVVTRASVSPTYPDSGNKPEPTPTPTPTPEPGEGEHKWILEVQKDTTAVIAEGTPEQVKAAADAIALAVANYANTGVTIESVSSPVTVKPTGDGKTPSAVTLNVQIDKDKKEFTTMAIVNADGTLTPVPTKVNSDGTVTVIVHGEVTLVAVNVRSSFIDTTGHYADKEINRAAELLLVNGVGNNKFAPARLLTIAEASTIFLRALGIPASIDAPAASGVNQEKWYAAYVNTAIANKLIAMTNEGIEADHAMTRIQAATMIVNALNALKMDPKMTIQEANELLKGFKDLEGLKNSERIDLAITFKLGIFKGNGNGTMKPLADLERAHLASVALRFQDYILNR